MSLRIFGLATFAFAALAGMPARAATFFPGVAKGASIENGLVFTPIRDGAKGKARVVPPASNGGRKPYYLETLAFVAVPEPTTWAMMFVGFGSIGLAVRSRGRRRAKVVSA